jgi:FAD/FMN-containing dehydrogenase
MLAPRANVGTYGGATTAGMSKILRRGTTRKARRRSSFAEGHEAQRGGFDEANTREGSGGAKLPAEGSSAGSARCEQALDKVAFEGVGVDYETEPVRASEGLQDPDIRDGVEIVSSTTQGGYESVWIQYILPGMARKTPKQSREKLTSSFEGRIGRIKPSDEAYTEFPGGTALLVPESTEDLIRALRLAWAANRRVSVRSGRNVSSTEKASRAPNAKAAAGKAAGAVVSMEAFREIRVDPGSQQITVGVAATTAELASILAEKDIFLPLEGSPTQSIVSAMLCPPRSPFLRSGTGPGALRAAVVQAAVVPIRGSAGLKKRTKAKLRGLWDGSNPEVITTLTLDASAWKKSEATRWVQAWMVPYERDTFTSLCDALLTRGVHDVDLTIRATSAAFSMKLVIVRTTGCGEAARQAAEAVVRGAFERARSVVLACEQVAGPGASVAAWVTTGAGDTPEPGGVHTRFSHQTPRPFTSFQQEFLEAVDFAVGVDSLGRERAPGVEAWAELQLTPNDEVVARAHVAETKAAKPGFATEACRRLERAMPTEAPTAKTRNTPATRRATAALRDVVFFDLLSSNRAGGQVIPGFKGDVLVKSEDRRSYHQATEQYAASSYGPEVVARRMKPQILAEPEDASDVVTAVNYAAKSGLKVVARSGGHQYCGLSSGGDETLLLDMKRLRGLTFSPDDGSGPSVRVAVGPGVKLLDLSAQLRGRRAAIPHGECPLVNIGGHVQTGGIGHQLRSLGATLDWVREFKMVTWDPQSQSYQERAFTRPTSKIGAAVVDDDVFRAVLGGGPGSWGVLTEISFDLVRDDQYPTSHGYSRVYFYQRAAFWSAMNQLQQWASRVANGTLPEGVDLFLTVISGEFRLFWPSTQLRPDVLIVETMCREVDGLRDIDAVVSAVESTLSGGTVTVGKLLGRGLDGQEPLSAIADAGVRRLGAFGMPASGREFDLPYKKSLYIAMQPPTDAFCDRFVDLVDRVRQQKGLRVVFQGVVGGGKFRDNGRYTTFMQRREGLVQLVFDIFYEPGREGEAERYQTELKGLLAEYSGGADVRMFWGTFEDSGANGSQLEMARQEVQDFYYDSPKVYARLQQIKRHIDPQDIFHTAFTVQLPSADLPVNAAPTGSLKTPKLKAAPRRAPKQSAKTYRATRRRSAK